MSGIALFYFENVESRELGVSMQIIKINIFHTFIIKFLLHHKLKFTNSSYNSSSREVIIY